MYQQPVVLYVEDEERSRKVMRMIASDMGLSTVTIFENSQDFLPRALALDPRPDVIFLDIHMKPFTGFEMLEMLRQTPQYEHTPIVAMTASVMNEEVQQLRTAGFDGCLAKPLDMDTFPESLNRIVMGEQIWRIFS
ncbi:MAG: response regulator [Anaerolineae bacterium]|nr:response regulator [Anaerolineae bacterium]